MVTDWHYNWVNHLVGLAATSNVWSRMVSEIQCQVIIIYYDDQKNQRYHDPTRSSFPTCLLILMVTWPPFSLLRLLGLLSETLFFFPLALMILYYSFSEISFKSRFKNYSNFTGEVGQDIYLHLNTLRPTNEIFFRSRPDKKIFEQRKARARAQIE